MSEVRAASALPHIVIPPDQWPREAVYYFCPDCLDVLGIAKIDTPGDKQWAR